MSATTTKTPAWLRQLHRAGACADAVTFAQGFDSFAAAWTACARGDWLLWWIGRTVRDTPPRDPARRPLVRVACQCARLALGHVRAGETRPLAAIALAERWADGDDSVTRAQLRAAYAAADAAAAAAAARGRVFAQCADLVRAEWPTPPALPQRRTR